jgi:hypothetical protein|tara:strand:+ start:3780 stop:4136 length:357 start_codon:yes stop_codon:yes gene_type:complete
MAVHSISVKELISRVRMVFPSAPEKYLLELINDALVEIGTHKVKVVHAKITTVADRMYYDLADGSVDSAGNRLEVNQVLRAYLMDNEGDYIQIPRLIDKDLLLADITSESNLNVPDGT